MGGGGGDMSNAYKIFVGKSQQKMRERERDIRRHTKETGSDRVDKNHVTQVQIRAVVYEAVNSLISFGRFLNGLRDHQFLKDAGLCSSK
jgi:hypothetical protein